MGVCRISVDFLKQHPDFFLVMKILRDYYGFSFPDDTLVDLEHSSFIIHGERYSYKLYERDGKIQILLCTQKGEYHVIVPNSGVYVSYSKKHGSHFKTNHGRIKKAPVVQLGIMAAALFLVSSSLNRESVELPHYPETSIETTSEVNEEESLDTDVSFQTENEVISESSSSEEVSMEETPYISSTVVITADPVITNPNREAKRAETDELYGDYILEYSTRYGQPYALVASLLTQERSDNPNDDLRVRQNIGQLTTTAVCGEKIVAPVFSNGVLQGYDKIYVLPPCYDDYPLEDLETMGHFPSFSEEEQQKIQEAIRLKKEGYQIYRRCDAFYEAENNVKISTAILAYVGNMKHDLVKEVMSYHAGYVKVANDVSNDTILNGQLDAEDPNYVGHVLQYFRPDELEQLEIYFTDGMNTWVVSYEIQLSEVLNEETGYHL